MLKYETLDAEEVKIIINGGKLDKPTVSDLLALEQKKAEEKKNKQPSEDSLDGNNFDLDENFDSQQHG